MLDEINGAFEAGLAVMLFLNLRRLMKDKEVKGFDYKVVVFTTAWGVWNLYYYPMLGQMFSFYAGIGVVTMNATWLYMVWYFKRESNSKEADETYRRIMFEAAKSSRQLEKHLEIKIPH